MGALVPLGMGGESESSQVTGSYHPLGMLCPDGLGFVPIDAGPAMAKIEPSQPETDMANLYAQAAAAVQGESEGFLQEIIDHGIHNLTNAYSDDAETYDAWAEAFAHAAREELRRQEDLAWAEANAADIMAHQD